jgi:multicomponent Na+:H+ antiporter subunit E
MRSASWLARAAIVAWLTIMWVLLWGELTVMNVVVGAVLGTALMVVFPPHDTNDDPIVIRPLKSSWFVIWFLWQLIITNIAVAKEVLLPSRRSAIRTAVVAVQLQTESGRLATIIANAITLTPGTLTLDARNRPATLYVHVLSFESVAATREEVADLERRVVGAFGTAEEVARICVDASPAASEEIAS